jgi:hypothetical protein
MAARIKEAGMPSRNGSKGHIHDIMLLLALLLAGVGCSAPAAVPPTTMPTAPIPGVQPTAPAPIAVQPTWTRPPAPATDNTPIHSLVVTPRPTRTPLHLPNPTATLTPTPTSTLTPTATAIPTLGPITSFNPPPDRPNLLPNPSFEESWYHPAGIDELQVPNRWVFDWLEGPNQLDPDPWNAWVRPEFRVLSPEFLPPSEHDLFIWDGSQTLKAFKGEGAISFNLQTSVYLDPGRYLFVTHVFPDLVVEYGAGGQKVWAPDPLSGEVAFIVRGVQQPWQLPRFGQKNRFTQVVVVEEPGLVQLGFAVRGRWAITNNGWFLDDWALYRLD